jgi:hypothetical protein
MTDNNPYLNRFLLALIAVVATLIAQDYIPARHADELGAIGLVTIVVAVILGIRALVLAGVARSRQGGGE